MSATLRHEGTGSCTWCRARSFSPDDPCVARILAHRAVRRRSIYVASRASLPERPAMWLRFRDAGHPIVSTWIDESGPSQTACKRAFWHRLVEEVACADALLLYLAVGDLPLKGAYVEVGAALAHGRPVGVVLDPLDVNLEAALGSWVHHPDVVRFHEVEQALHVLAGVCSVCMLAEAEHPVPHGTSPDRLCDGCLALWTSRGPSLDRRTLRDLRRAQALRESRGPVEPCCPNERRTMAGGCASCGDPSF